MTVWLTTEEIAEVIRETPHTVSQRCATGQLPAVKIGGEWRVADVDLDKAIRSGALSRGARIRDARVKTTAARRKAS